MAFATWTPYSPASNETIATLISDFSRGNENDLWHTTHGGNPLGLTDLLGQPRFFDRSFPHARSWGYGSCRARQEWAMTRQLQRSRHRRRRQRPVGAALPGRTSDHRVACFGAFRRGSNGAVDARRVADQMASGPHVLVLRDLLAEDPAALRFASSTLASVPLQLVLRDDRRATSKGRARQSDPTRAWPTWAPTARFVDSAMVELIHGIEPATRRARANSSSSVCSTSSSTKS